ncbi:MAG: hypothetical protein Q4C48_04765 [Lachnospiraceae bacterium]|nr:hypothetical protein [Lachnospiraceae bacterium]
MKKRKKNNLIIILAAAVLFVTFLLGKKLVFYLHDRAETDSLFEEVFPFSFEDYEVVSREDTVLWNAYGGSISVTLLADEAEEQKILAEAAKLGFEDVTKQYEGNEYWNEYILILERNTLSRRELWSAVDVPKHLPTAFVRVKMEGERYVIELVYMD